MEKEANHVVFHSFKGEAGNSLIGATQINTAEFLHSLVAVAWLAIVSLTLSQGYMATTSD